MLAIRPTKIASFALSAVLLSSSLLSCGSTVRAEDIDTGDGSVLSYNFDLEPFIKVGKYMGVAVELEPIEVSETEIDERVDLYLQQATSYETVTEGTVKDGDTVNFDFVGYMNGEPFENGSGEGATTVIGKGYYIEDLENGMIGHSVGETFNVPVTFPSDYHAAELAGAAAEFEVKLNYILVADKPEATDQWVEENTDASTLAEWRELIRMQLEQEKDSQHTTDARDKLWQTIMDGSEVLYWPQGPITYYHDNYIKYFTDLAAEEGKSLEEYLDQYGVTSEQFYEDADTSAYDSVKTDLVFRYICEKEDIGITDEEYYTMANEFYNGYYYRMFDTFEAFESEYGAETLRLSVMYEKMMDYLYDNAEITQK